MELTQNRAVLDWIDQMVNLCQPDSIVWIDGSEAQLDSLRKIANNWMDPQEMYAKLFQLYTGAMKGRTMYVIPYSMGVVGSPFAKYGIELTDSIYVVLNMAIMTRVGRQVLDALGDSPDYVKGLHAKADIDPENRYIVHFPEDNTIMSVNSGYGGNVLLGKKCFALRIASVLGRDQGWMAEHMLIRYRLAPCGQGRPPMGHEPRVRLFRCGAGHQ